MSPLTTYEQIDMALTTDYGFATFLDAKDSVSMDNLSSLWDEYLQAKDYPTYFDDAIEEIIAINKYSNYYATSKYSQQILDAWEKFIIGDMLGKVVFECIPINAPVEKNIWSLFLEYTTEDDELNADNILADSTAGRFVCPIVNQLIYQSIIRKIAFELQEDNAKRKSIQDLQDVAFDTHKLEEVGIVEASTFFKAYLDFSMRSLSSRKGHDFDDPTQFDFSDFYYLDQIIKLEMKGFCRVYEQQSLLPFFTEHFLDQLALYTRAYLIFVQNKIRLIDGHNRYIVPGLEIPKEQIRLNILKRISSILDQNSLENWCYVYFAMKTKEYYEKNVDFIRDLDSIGIKAPSKTQFSRCYNYIDWTGIQMENWYTIPDHFIDGQSKIKEKVKVIIDSLRDCI